MRIKVTCADCGKIITIDVHKVERLEKEIEILKKRLSKTGDYGGDQYYDFAKELSDILGGKR